MGTFLARVGAAAGVLAAVVACMPLTGANADGCPDADPGMDYCGHCKSTDKCHYCTTGHCVGSDPCACSPPLNCVKGTHEEAGRCVPNTSSGGTSSSSSSSSGSSGSDIGLPCTTGAHPAWQDGECSAATACKYCSVRACVRVTAQGCCAGEDTPSEFFPCAGCGSCNDAVQAALRRCGCNQ